MPIFVFYTQLRPFTEAQASQQHQRVGVLLAVGPEGGWIPPEMDLLQQRLRCVPFRLSDKVLKCEAALTACLTQLTLCYEEAMFLPLLRSPEEVYAAAEARAAVPSSEAVSAGSAADRADAAELREPQKRQGGREVVRLPGGFLMSFPQRYSTRATASEQRVQQHPEECL